jgi:alpha-ketoglutarate-dependent taurine dioxygenase
VLVIPEQPIDALAQERLASVFGNIDDRTIDKFGRPDGERAHYVSNTRKDGSLPTGELCFHNDQLFYDKPNRCSMLHGVQVASKGGQTRFVNTALVYEELPEEERRILDTATAVNVFDYDARGGGTERVEMADLSPTALYHSHPAIFHHPISGRASIWITRNNTIRLVELDKAESDVLIESVCDRVQNCAYIYDHPWMVGDTVIWDNWMVQHARHDFDPAEPRTLRRIPVNASSDKTF